MPNNYFQFKQFIVQQDKCSMKVCTDACLFGAVASNFAKGKGAKNILDIGTGTGLLSLMMAQNNSSAIIDAIEIEENAYQQAKENFTNSPWKERLKIFNADAKEFIAEEKYDLIISNPPFFENDLKSDERNKNVAKHNEALTLEDLIEIIKTNLSPTGSFAVLLPYQRTIYFENLASESEFHLQEKLLIRQTPSHNFFRAILFFTREKTNAATKELAIKNSEGNYTNEFVELMKEFYLNL